MKIHVHIDRLVLEGLPVDRHSAPLIQEAVQTELSRLFADSGASSSLLSAGAMPSLRTVPDSHRLKVTDGSCWAANR